MTVDQKIINAQREATEKLINENRVAVNIVRRQIVDRADGGRHELITVLPMFWGRIVARNVDTGMWTDEAGVGLISRLTLYAPWNANLEASSDVHCSFEVGLKRYRIVSVVPRYYGNQVYAYHARIEEIK